MSGWSEIVGQADAVAQLRRAASVEGDDARGTMTHAWLLTGPPGSGRSVAARAFASALQCPSGGCGECRECRTAADGTANTSVGVARNASAVSGRSASSRVLSTSTAVATRTLVAPSA